MHFVFDIDETLVRGDIIQAVSTEMFHAKELSRLYSGRDVRNFDLDGLPDNLKARVVEAFHEPRFSEMKEPIPEAYYFLCALTLHGHRISALTARAANLKELTLKTLQDDFPKVKFETIEFCNSSGEVKLGDDRPNKRQKLIDLNPDVYFDDSIEYCNTAAQLGIETYLISNIYTGWNQTNSNVDQSIKRIKHVGQFDCRRI